jgi:hypothetical protein
MRLYALLHSCLILQLSSAAADWHPMLSDHHPISASMLSSILFFVGGQFRAHDTEAVLACFSPGKYTCL